MNELRSILKERIENIFELQGLGMINESEGEFSNQKYEVMIEQKKAEKYRSIKETELLLSLNAMTLGQNSHIEELYNITVEICSFYDSSFTKFKDKVTVSMRQNLRKLYCDFFNAHGFQNKSKQVNLAFQKPLNAISPAMLLGWLSEWSKKLYCEMLQKQIKASFAVKEKKFKPISNNSIVLLQKKVEDKDIDQADLSSMYLNGRANIYGLILDELSSFYKWVNLQGVDHAYLKTIKRKNRKQDLLKPSALKKASQIMAECAGNKQIGRIMVEYFENYTAKYPKPKIEMRNIQPLVKKPIESPKKKQRNITQSQGPMNFNASKLLSSKFSQFQFFKPEAVEFKIKKLKFINGKALKNNLHFPEIRKNIPQLKGSVGQIPSMQKSNLESKISTSSLEKEFRQYKKDDSRLFRCESIHSKAKPKDDESSLMDGLYGDRLQSPKKMKKNIFQPESEYDDKRLKMGKNFDLGDLKLNNRTALVKAKFICCGKSQH